MPMVNRPHESKAHRLVSRSHPSPTRPVISAAIANANGTVKPIYPRYSNGGWKSTRMWFCSNGLGPGPSKPTGTVAPGANGDAGPKLTRAKNVMTTYMTTKAQATSSSSRRLANRRATPPVKSARTITQSKIEPSKALHIAATL